jgi:aryl-alcohol dehydrogenase-like predicted oxidoreductase
MFGGHQINISVKNDKMKTRTRKLGRSGIEVSSVGLGCWAIGGPLWYQTEGKRIALSYGQVNDDDSIKAIHRALNLGINFFDTADAYGGGHSERILGQALKGYRDEVIICTKFGGMFEEDTRTWLGDPDLIQPESIRKACEASLQRLNTDYIDLYLFHCNAYDAHLAKALVPMMETLVDNGMIRAYGWSTVNPDRARTFIEGPHCTAMEYHYNIFERNAEMLALCEEFDQANIIRGPLAMGLLTGKFSKSSKVPNDIRAAWDMQEGRQAKQLEMLEMINDILIRDGRTLTQAALGWLLALGPQVIPIPGFKTEKQVEEISQTLQYGPLSNKQMTEINKILAPYADSLTLQK